MPADEARSNAKPFFEGKLTRSVLMQLPPYGILRSNASNDGVSPDFEAVLLPTISREELWIELRQRQLTGRTFGFFVDGASYDVRVAECGDALIRHLITRKKITKGSQIWKIRRHHSSELRENSSKEDTFDVWGPKPRLLLAPNIARTSLREVLDKLIGEHGSPDMIRCHNSYALDDRDFMTWALHRGVDLVFVP